MSHSPDSKDAIALAAASLAVSALIWATLAALRAGVGDPFQIPVYRHLIFFQDFYAVAPFIAALALALLAPLRRMGAAAAGWCGRHVLLVAGLSGAALAAGTGLVYHHHPLSLDEYAVLFQSRVFAAGRLTGQYPPALIDWLIPQFFQGRFVKPSYETGQVIAIYWPGFSTLLTPFTALGTPWLLNPLLGAGTLLVVHQLALRLFRDAQSAGYAVLFTLASPAVTINAISYYSMPAHLLASALYALLLVEPTPRRALGAGLVGSAALLLHNPAPHLLFALPWIAWLATRPDRWRVLGALAAGYLPSIPLGWSWALFAENFGRGAGAHSIGATVPAGNLLSRLLGRVFAWSSSTGFSSHLLDLFKLWLWAVPALVAAAALGAWRERPLRGPWLALAGSAALTYFGYFLVQFDQGHGWGFRYFHSAWLAVPLFAVCAIRRAPALASYLGACALLSLVVLTGFRAVQVEQYIARHLAQRPAVAAGDARVTFVDISRGYYAWDLIQNDPFLRGPITFRVREPAADRAMMAQRFPQYELLGSDARGSVWGLRR
ncbi:MAG TPA: hypothetical protein VFB08_05625 [Burkholderiales bacterium]|nr:hypothetical protein [Burkholderiales bacterium]